ncbi:beta-N-acetylhexosaminidase [Deinococcus sp.]|uniref:beta-N-acetylhexosaminidase n=1 Tax=Deinococcus sp. TaxID=47478 RepID=UPI003B58B707
MTLLPLPADLQPLSGTFILSPDSVIQAGPDTQQTAGQLADFLRPATGFALPVVERADKTPAIHLELSADLTTGPEGYELEVLPGGVTLRAAAPAGLFYAAQTLRQLLPPAIFSPQVTQADWSMDAVLISDQPRFGWRGQHLDCARHFMPLPFIYKLLDVMALHKLNTFHWHLTDDQGWRLEIERYPRLTEVGAWRKGTRKGHERDPNGQFDNVRHGGFYTQAEARAVVAYAAERHIRVIPEIEMPGHAQAAIAAYPQLGNTGEALEVAQQWGVIEHVFNAEESTITFLQNVLEEVLDIFPSPYIHVGGDECPKTEWRESAAAQARIAALNLPDENALQSYFIARMDTFLQERGRHLIGWDEILEGGLAPHAAVMSWQGEEGGIAAARQGHDVVMVPQTHVYFDYYQSEDQASEPLAIGGYTPLEKVYAYEPIPAELTPEEAKHVLGSQGQLWTEYIATPEHAEYMLFPRLCALSEVLWTPANQKDYADFRQRLTPQLERLQALGVGFRGVD